MDSVITLDYGSGGAKTASLIDELVCPAFSCRELSKLDDGALLKTTGEIAFSTDSFVVDPIFFPGGDIGKLAVCGTSNDLAMCGARPKWLSFAVIIEEGLEYALLKSIFESAAAEAARLGIKIVTGDTKVVEKGRGDRIYINTSGIGETEYHSLSRQAIVPGDNIIVSGPVGDHGMAIMLAREDLGIESPIKSDCMQLYPLAKAAWEAGGLHFLRDATRGGIATTLNEFCEGQSFGIEIDEEKVPVRKEVRSAGRMLGIDPLYCACEGRMLAVVSRERTEAVLSSIRAQAGGEDAAVIGSVTADLPGRVCLKTELGAKRIIGRLRGALLPRIC